MMAEYQQAMVHNGLLAYQVRVLLDGQEEPDWRVKRE